jgi:hypothetical protein
MTGYILARLPETGLDKVTDPRRGPKRWKLWQLLTAVTVGAMAGCGSLREVEQLTELLSPAMRRRLGLARRQPDTTLRDALCALSVDELRACLHRLVRAAWRRKALAPQELPFGVLTLDGKSTALPCWNELRQARAGASRRGVRVVRRRREGPSTPAASKGSVRRSRRGRE